MKKVYLCGPISGLTYDQATVERERVVDLFREHGVEALSPMRGKISYVEKRSDALKSRGYQDVARSDKAIVSRDRFDVMSSDLIFADLRGASKVSIGSMVEYGWADAYRKPVVTIMEEDNVHQHAFVLQLSTYVTDDFEEAFALALSLLNVRR